MPVRHLDPPLPPRALRHGVRTLARAAAAGVALLAGTAHAGPLLDAQLTLSPELFASAAPVKPAPSPPPDVPAPVLGTPARPDVPAADDDETPIAPRPHAVITPGSRPAPGEPQPAGNGNLDFDLLGDSGKAPSAADLHRGELARTRRTVLTLHQAAGLTTLGLLAGTVVVGQLSYMDKFSTGRNSGRYELPHEALATATLAGFATTGLLALFAPVPYDKPVEVDTTFFHKLCMGGATAGMAAEGVLGLYTAGREGFQNQKSLAQVHLFIGYATLALMGAGAGAFVF